LVSSRAGDKVYICIGIHQSKMVARFTLAMAAFAGIGALIAFATLLGGVQVTAAQQQTTPTETHHMDNSSNQSGTRMTEQQQNTTTLSEMVMNQTFNSSSISLVRDVNVTDISMIDNEHIAINLSHDDEGEPPGVSVVAAITNSSSDTIIVDSIMQNSTSTTNSSAQIMQSGSNYLEAGWQSQHPNSATVLVQLDGEIPEGGRITVMGIPFLRH
jgi:hypothetical protein